MKTISYFLLALILFSAFSIRTSAQTGKPFNLGNSQHFLSELKQQTPSNAKIGMGTVSLQASESESFTGLVNLRKEWEGGIYLAGGLESMPSASFFIRIDNSEITGHIIIKDSEKAFRYLSDELGNAYIQEEDIHEIICIDYENAPDAPSGSDQTLEDTLDIQYADPLLESFPGANGVVLLDFDGQYVSGTLWNDGNPIDAAPSGMTPEQILEVWELVSEDFKPFNINITTDESVFNSYPLNRRMRCIITPTNTAAPGSGGVAYVNSFSWDDNTPCWVFITTRAKRCGEASSHEIGHTLGLRHDGTSSEDYFTGHGNWAPIMGAGYSRSITHWSIGEYADANNSEDDLYRITRSTNGLGYRVDDHGNNPSTASVLSVDGSGNISATVNTGIIERNTDVDMFSFSITGGNITLTFNPASRHADLDILVKLYNSSGTLLTESDATGLATSLTQNLTAGTYFVSVEGTGAADPLTSGYTDYASLGIYSISGTIPAVQVAQDPYGGQPWPISGKVEAENYDEGGMSVSYFDGTEANEGGAYRTDEVDLSNTNSETYLSYINQGEWLEFTVDVKASGYYQVKARVGSTTETGSFRLDFNDADVSGTISVPNTGGWESWQEIEGVIELQEGIQIMRLYAVTGGFNIDYLDFIAVQLDCNMDVNGTASIDGCGICSGGNTGIEPCAGTIEGETVCDISDGVISTSSTGYSGSGYFNFTNAQGAAGYWPLSSETNLTTTLTFRYANGSTNSRNTSLSVDGALQIETVEFPPTGGWSNWSTTSVQVSLSAGGNILELISLISEGGPHIDLIYYSSAELSLGSCTSPEDCHGNPGGTAAIDNCGVCSGGTTGIEPNSSCEQDCEGVWKGTAYMDNCSICVEGTTGLLPCADIPDGNYIIKPMSSGLCIEGTSGLTQENCTSISNQIWQLAKSGDHYQIKNLNGSYVTFNDVTAGTTLSLSNGTSNIDIRIEDAGNGTYTIKPSTDYHIYFDVYGNSLVPGADIILWSATGGNNQLFQFVPATVTAVNNQLTQNVHIYPNPVESKLSIVNGSGEWILKDITGIALLKGVGSNADLSSLSSGLYFLEVDGQIIKVVKK